MTEITNQSLNEIIENVKTKKISSTDLTKAYIKNIESAKKLNAFVTTTFDHALDKAKQFDDKPNFDQLLPGIPLAVKDLFCTENTKTTAGSNILSNFIPSYESTVTKNLWNNGSFLLGKLNCDEFAMGSSNETAAKGNVVNPWLKNSKMSPGGSSGGSASAVASRSALAATGTDAAHAISSFSTLLSGHLFLLNFLKYFIFHNLVGTSISEPKFVINIY